MSAKNAIYNGQNQRGWGYKLTPVYSTRLEAAMERDTMYNMYNMFNMYMCRWSTATFMMLTSVAEEQSARPRIGNLI